MKSPDEKKHKVNHKKAAIELKPLPDHSLKSSVGLSDLVSGKIETSISEMMLELCDPIDLALSSRINRFFRQASASRNLWKRHVEQEISDSPKLLKTDLKDRAGNDILETYKQMYQRVYDIYKETAKVITNLSKYKNPKAELHIMFAKIIVSGFDKFEKYFPNLYEKINLNAVIKIKNHECLTTFLHLAAAHGHASFVQRIIASGGNIQAIGNAYLGDEEKGKPTKGAGDTPLITAARNGYTDCVVLLMGRAFAMGINHSYLNYSRKLDRTTALHEAAKNGHSDCVRTLLALGASTQILNCYGECPLEVAIETTCRGLIRNTMRERGESLENSSWCIVS